MEVIQSLASQSWRNEYLVSDNQRTKDDKKRFLNLQVLNKKQEKEDEEEEDDDDEEATHLTLDNNKHLLQNTNITYCDKNCWLQLNLRYCCCQCSSSSSSCFSTSKQTVLANYTCDHNYSNQTICANVSLPKSTLQQSFRYLSLLESATCDINKLKYKLKTSATLSINKQQTTTKPETLSNKHYYDDKIKSTTNQSYANNIERNLKYSPNSILLLLLLIAAHSVNVAKSSKIESNNNNNNLTSNNNNMTTNFATTANYYLLPQVAKTSRLINDAPTLSASLIKLPAIQIISQQNEQEAAATANHLEALQLLATLATLTAANQHQQNYIDNPIQRHHQSNNEDDFHEEAHSLVYAKLGSIDLLESPTTIQATKEQVKVGEVLRDGNNQVISSDKLFEIDEDADNVASMQASAIDNKESTNKLAPLNAFASLLSTLVGWPLDSKATIAADSKHTKLSNTLDENKRRDLIVQTGAIESRGLLSLDSSNHLMLPQMQQIKSRFNQGCVGGTKCQFFAFCWMSGGSLGASCGILMTCCVTPSKTEIQPVFYGPVVNDPYCGRSTSKISRIVGGTDASFGQFPWQAFVQVGGSRCGGALISSRHVVTAGHCVARSQHSPSSIKVTLGDYILNSDIESLPHEVFSVVEVLLHPNFRFTPQADRYDVAVLELDRVASYKDNIRPICLPQKDATFVGRVAYVAGWGALQAGSKLRPKVLQHVAVPVIENNVCETWHRHKGIDIRIYDEMMCAGYEMGQRDACQGDSGGPLMLNQFGVWYLVGIVSAGYSCAKQYQPGIYHRVSSSSDWISSNLDRT